MAEKRVESVERALTLLNTFESPADSWSLAELAQKTGYYKSTILRLMGSLERFGYVVRGADGRHQLGPAFLRLGDRARGSVDFESVVRPALIELRNVTGETASLYVREGRERVCLFREIGHGELLHYVQEGARFDINTGAAGHALISQERGKFYVSRGERVPGLAAIAVPVVDRRNRCFGAITLSGSLERFDDATCERLSKVLIEFAEKLAIKLDTFPLPYAS